jgi:hypothetical protein
MLADPEFPLDGLTDEQVSALVRRLTDELSHRGTHAAFAELLRLVGYVGEQVGTAARTLASSSSWSEVAAVSGTSKQAAWERWRG